MRILLSLPIVAVVVVKSLEIGIEGFDLRDAPRVGMRRVVGERVKDIEEKSVGVDILVLCRDYSLADAFPISNPLFD